MKGAIGLPLVGIVIGAAVPNAKTSGLPGYLAPGIRFRGRTLPQRQGSQPRGVDVVTPNYVEMQRTSGRLPTPNWQVSLHKDLGDTWDLTADAVGTKVATTNMTFFHNTNYVVPIKIGKQELLVAVDTGSSDTWVIQNNFTCVDPIFGSIKVRPRSICAFSAPNTTCPRCQGFCYLTIFVIARVLRIWADL